MKVHLIKKQTIEDFAHTNVQSRASFTNWLAIIRNVDWNLPLDIVTTFNSADILGDSSRRVVFNIGGNNYRMICKYNFGSTMIHLSIKWIGTHSDYDKLCKAGEQFTINAH